MSRMSRLSTLPHRSVAALIGSTLGLVYVVVNAGVLPTPAREVVRALGVLAFLVVLLRVRTSRSPTDDPPTGRSGFGHGYWRIVAAEVLVGLGGAVIITRPLGTPNAALPWITLVVGVHFFALGRLWRLSIQYLLGGALTACGAAGLLAAAGGATDEAIATIAGTVPGALLLAAAFWATRQDQAPTTNATEELRRGDPAHGRARH